MKRSLLILSSIVLPLTLIQCNREELTYSKQQNDSLRTVIKEKENAIDNFISEFNSIEVNLDEITARQKNIVISTGEKTKEFKPDQKARINAEIEAINALMEENRNTISELNDKLKKMSKKNAHLEKTIATLNRQYFQKNLELTTLNDQLNQLNMEVATLKVTADTLRTENLAQLQTIETKNKALHTAYYIVGRSKELQEANLIDKEGGLLGIGRTSKLNADIDNSKFFRIDYTETNSIPVNSNHMKIITSHPSDSYKLDMKDKDLVSNIVITDPEKFWSASKYLVVVNN